jgi:hypothetical protein
MTRTKSSAPASRPRQGRPPKDKAPARASADDYAAMLAQPHMRPVFAAWLEPAAHDLAELWCILDREGAPGPEHEDAAGRFESITGVALWHPFFVGALRHGLERMKCTKLGRKVQAKVRAMRGEPVKLRGRPPGEPLAAFFDVLAGDPWYLGLGKVAGKTSHVGAALAAAIALGLERVGVSDEAACYRAKKLRQHYRARPASRK